MEALTEIIASVEGKFGRSAASAHPAGLESKGRDSHYS